MFNGKRYFLNRKGLFLSLFSFCVTSLLVACSTTPAPVQPEPHIHSFSDWNITQEATEGIDGVKSRKCVGCNFEETEAIPALSHVHSYTETVFLATCIENGFTRKTCSCGDVIDDNIQPAHGHNYSDWTVIIEPTYDTTGEKHRTCTVCGTQETQTIKKIPRPHVHSFTEITVQPTCTTGGYTKQRCKCGVSSLISETTALGHNYCEWYTSLEPEKTVCGLQRRDCSVCGEAEMKTIPIVVSPPPSLDDESQDSESNTDQELFEPSTSGSNNSEPPETEDGDTPIDEPRYAITHYSQKDERWGNLTLGCGNMRNNGCGPTSIAMALSHFGIFVTPYDVASWLYTNTIEFNRGFHGISGTGIKLGLEHYGRTVVPINTFEEFKQHLQNGAVIVGAQGTGRFISNPNSSHCIVISGPIENNKAQCYDPLTDWLNKPCSIDTLWNERSQLSVDLRQEGVSHFAVY